MPSAEKGCPRVWEEDGTVGDRAGVSASGLASAPGLLNCGGTAGCPSPHPSPRPHKLWTTQRLSRFQHTWKTFETSAEVVPFHLLRSTVRDVREGPTLPAAQARSQGHSLVLALCPQPIGEPRCLTFHLNAWPCPLHPGPAWIRAS